MRKLLLAVLLLALPVLLVPLFLFRPGSPLSKNILKKLELPQKKDFIKPASRGRKQTKETDTLDSLLKYFRSPAKKNDKAPARKRSSKKGSNQEAPNPVTQVKTVFQSFLQQLQTDENGKMLLELFQTPNSEPVQKRRVK
jgi:hypothetical protein